MKQINRSVINEISQNREPADWCLLCDNNDRCSSCDAKDWDDIDCGNCDFESEE